MEIHAPEASAAEAIQAAQDQSLDTKTALMLFVGLVIVVIYLICLLLIIVRRAKKLLELYNRRYYLFISFYIVSKLVISAILGIEIVVGFTNDWGNLNTKTVELMIKSGIILADFSIIQMFLVSLEHYFELCLSTLKDSLSKKTSKMMTLALRGFQIFVSALLLIPLVIMDFDSLSYNVLNGIGLGLNLLVMIFFLATFFYFNLKMTGVLVEERLNEVIKRVYKVQLIILVSRAFMIAFELLIAIYIDDSFQGKIEDIQQDYKPQVVLAMVFILSIVFMLLTEGLPVMYSLRNNVVQCLNYRPVAYEHKQSIFTDYASDIDDSLLDKKVNSSDNQQNDTITELKLKSFKRLTDIPSDKDEESIWIIKKGTLEGRDYIIRISKHEISNYIFEDMENEISLWSQLNIPSLSKLSYFYQGDIIHLVERFFHHRLDEVADKATDEAELIRLSIKVGQAIKMLHDKDVVHGCITPDHVYLEKDRVILNGCGLHSLRKYLSLITGYTNKTMYTAVELLKDKNNVTLKPSKPADVYSFGIVLYELVTKNKQYRQLSLREVIIKFADENFRPKLPESIRADIKNLIRRCWHESPDRRPEIEEVIDQLRRFV